MSSERNGRIDYLELPTRDIKATRSFFETVFGWQFREWGDEYVSFKDGAVEGATDGGFYHSETPAQVATGSALVVLYHSELESIYTDAVTAGATIVKEVFDFPGGRRFHFLDPSGNEFAIWSDK